MYYSISNKNLGEDDSNLIREIEIKKKQIEYKQKELLVLRKKKFDNCKLRHSMEDSIEFYINSLRCNEKFIIQQQHELDKREVRMKQKEYILHRIMLINDNSYNNDEEIYQKRKKFLHENLSYLKHNNSNNDFKVSGGGIVVMNKPKKQSLTMKKKKNLNNLIIEKPNNISITKPKKRCKTVNTNTTRSIPKENNQRDEKILDLASCRYKHISDKYLRELMIKGQDNKNNQSRNKEVMKQTIQSGSTIGVNGGNTRNSTITNPSLNVKHKTEKPFKEIEDLVDEYDKYCNALQKKQKRSVETQTVIPKKTSSKSVTIIPNKPKNQKMKPILISSSSQTSINNTHKNQKEITYSPIKINNTKSRCNNPQRKKNQISLIKKEEIIQKKEKKKELIPKTPKKRTNGNVWKDNFQKQKKELLTLRAKSQEIQKKSIDTEESTPINKQKTFNKNKLIPKNIEKKQNNIIITQNGKIRDSNVENLIFEKEIIRDLDLLTDRERKNVKEIKNNDNLWFEKAKENIIYRSKEKPKNINIPKNSPLTPQNNNVKIIRKKKQENTNIKSLFDLKEMDKERNKTPKKGKVIKMFTPTKIQNNRELNYNDNNIEDSESSLRNMSKSKSQIFISESNNLLGEYEKLKQTLNNSNNKSIIPSTSSLNQSGFTTNSIDKSPMSNLSLISSYSKKKTERFLNKIIRILEIHIKKCFFIKLYSLFSQTRLKQLIIKNYKRKEYIIPIRNIMYNLSRVKMKIKFREIDQESLDKSLNESSINKSNLSIEEYEQELKKMIQISKETKNLEDDLNKFVQKNYVNK